MKAIQIMWRILIVLCLFVISDCFAGRPSRAGLRSRPLRSHVKRSKPKAASIKRAAQAADESQNCAMEADDGGGEAVDELTEQMQKMEFKSEEDYIKSLDPEIQEKIHRADRVLALGNTAEAIKLFEEIADKHQIPLVFDRLGDIHLEMVDDDPYNAVIAQRYFKMALEKGLVSALEKLLKIGDILGQITEKSKNPPMSEAAMRMYV